MRKINGIEVIGDSFAYDGNHKIYIIEDQDDFEKAKKFGYSIFPIEMLTYKYYFSDDLRYIINWKLTKTYSEQFDNPDFEGFREDEEEGK